MPQYFLLRNLGAMLICVFLAGAALISGCETFPLLTDPNLFSPSNLLPPDNGLDLRDQTSVPDTEPKIVNTQENPRAYMLFRGMSKGAALNVLLSEGISGRSSRFFNPKTYRSEMMKNGGRLVEVYYLPNADNDPAAGETPLVFDGDQLAGWGWEYYYKNLTP